ncbi:MAG: YraN family protein [Bdellovibrionales bacterium]|nr:YraN family protein [Bdellovibrionales bacterium]
MYIDHIKGRISEDTALNYFENQGYNFVARNYSICGIEVDLIFKKQGVYYIVEVKSENIWSFEHPISYRQMKRLKKAVEVFSETKQVSVQLLVAIVQNKEVQVYSLDDLFSA